MTTTTEKPVGVATKPRSIADLPAQRAASPRTEAEKRALYFNTGNAFNLKLPVVPDISFTDEPKLALDKNTPTSLIACDRSKEMAMPFPATTPLVLARYGRIRAGESLKTRFVASGVIFYVITGTGTTTCGDERIEWKQGDVFIMPGGPELTSTANGDDAVLWIVTNEPQLSFESLQAPAEGDAPTDAVHFPSEEIDRQIEMIYEIGRGNDIAGSALIFSSTKQEGIRNVLPTLTVAMNSLPAGMTQRPHRHNSVAVSLVIEGDKCFSTIDGRRKEWAPFATTITPPTSVHSHHNAGDKLAKFLIVQDGGIYYYTRALGFEFAEHPAAAKAA